MLEKRRALIIAVSEYNNPLQHLPFCKNDGEEIYELLKSLGYQIPDNNKLVGQVKANQIKDTIYDFFDNETINSQDTLLFYYSGHGIPDIDGDVYLASSEINPNKAYRNGFSFSELTKMMNRSSSTRVITILDCCYSGAAKLGKWNEDDAAKIGTAAIEKESVLLNQGEGKCILSASQATQEAYGKKKEDHSIFTFYLLQGLRPNKMSVDLNGNVTVDTLGNYVYNTIMSLPPDKKPNQKPVRKIEAGGTIILASYPQFDKSRETEPRVEDIDQDYAHPRLKIDKDISKQHVTINVNGESNGLPTPTEVFNGIVWNFRIENKLPTFVDGCTGEIFLPNLEDRVQLTWQRPSPLPEKYTSGAGLPKGLESYRHEYQRRLGVEYTGSLVMHGRPAINFPKSSSRDLHFLFTFPESKFAYIITMDGTWSWYDNDNFVNRIGDVSLVLEIPGTYDIHLTLSHDRIIRRYKLMIKNYNDISIQTG